LDSSHRTGINQEAEVPFVAAERLPPHAPVARPDGSGCVTCQGLTGEKENKIFLLFS
jgi:hypothetical protein